MSCDIAYPEQCDKKFVTCDNHQCSLNDNLRNRCKCENGIILGADGKCCSIILKPKQIKKFTGDIRDVAHAGLAYKINELIDAVNELNKEIKKAND